MKLSDALVEALAPGEHERWAGWQEHVHSYCAEGVVMESSNCIDPPTPRRTIHLAPHMFDRWKRQVETPFEQLSASEKESDRREVRRMLPAIMATFWMWIYENAYTDEPLTSLLKEEMGQEWYERHVEPRLYPVSPGERGEPFVSE